MKFLRVWRHPRALTEQLLGFALLGVAVWWWLGLAESGLRNTLLSAAAVLFIVGGFVILCLRARNQLAAGSSPVAVLAAFVLFIPCALAGYWIVWWVPGFESFAMQALSMAARFAFAIFIVLASWLNLLASVGKANAAS